MREIIGHGGILSAFDRLIAADRLAHAYLLAGPAHVGKATVAAWLAARLLCTASGRLPCGQCDACTAVARGVHPDVLRLSETDVLAVERVREWTSSLTRSALFAGWKIGIVEGAEQMQGASANACLKSIEEPTPRTVILLTASNRRAVLPTIASRCAVVACNRPPRTALAAALVGRGASRADAEALVALADGCPGRALTLMAEPATREAQEQRRALARAMTSGTLADRLRHVESFVRALPEDHRDAAAEAMVLMRECRAIARAAVPTLRASDGWIRWQRILARAPQDLAANVTARLLLETIAVASPS